MTRFSANYFECFVFCSTIVWWNKDGFCSIFIHSFWWCADALSHSFTCTHSLSFSFTPSHLSRLYFDLINFTHLFMYLLTYLPYFTSFTYFISTYSLTHLLTCWHILYLDIYLLTYYQLTSTICADLLTLFTFLQAYNVCLILLFFLSCIENDDIDCGCKLSDQVCNMCSWQLQQLWPFSF